jgi:uncharacterized sulfatase
VHYEYGGPREYPKPQWDHGTPIDEYDAGLVYTDDYIGRLLCQLQQLGVAGNTVVIVTSDHGEALGDHGLTYHGAALYWDLIHVPLIISYPGHLPAGARVSPPVSLTAIPAIVLDLVGGGNQEIFPKIPSSALWTSAAAGSKWQAPLSELAQTNIIVSQDKVVEGKIPIATNGDMDALVTDRWHLIMHSRLGAQLYDWNADRAELHNLAETPEGKASVMGLTSELSARTKTSKR